MDTVLLPMETELIRVGLREILTQTDFFQVEQWIAAGRPLEDDPLSMYALLSYYRFRDFTIAEMALEADVSIATMHRFVRSYTGDTPEGRLYRGTRKTRAKILFKLSQAI